jgi:hypothetical protein
VDAIEAVELGALFGTFTNLTAVDVEFVSSNGAMARVLSPQRNRLEIDR